MSKESMNGLHGAQRVQLSMEAQRYAWEHRMEPVVRPEKSQCAKDQEVRTSCE